MQYIFTKLSRISTFVLNDADFCFPLSDPNRFFSTNNEPFARQVSFLAPEPKISKFSKISTTRAISRASPLDVGAHPSALPISVLLPYY